MSSKFDCKMECDRFGDWCIRITHNGYQWTAVNVCDVDEANKLITLLQGWVRQQEIKESAPTDTQHTQAKMPSFEEMRKSCIERGICSEDGFYTNHFDTGFKAAYNCIARHFGCA